MSTMRDDANTKTATDSLTSTLYAVQDNRENHRDEFGSNHGSAFVHTESANCSHDGDLAMADYAYDEQLEYALDDGNYIDDDLPYFRPVLGPDGEPLIDENGDPVLEPDDDADADDTTEYDDEFEDYEVRIPTSYPTGLDSERPSTAASPSSVAGTEAIPGPSSGLASLLANASSYWSSTSNLGFGDATKEKMRLRAMADFELSEVQGAPIETEFHAPDQDVANEINLADTTLQANDPHAVSQLPQGRVRGSSRGRGRGRGRRGIAWALRGTAHDPKLRKAAEAPRGRGRSRGRPRGQLTLDPGSEFKRFHMEAMTAFMDGHMERALAAALEAIHKNPEVGVAHWLVSESLRSLGREMDSIGALMSGAVVDHDAKLWIDAGDRTLRLDEAITSRLAATNQALYCYTNALNYTKNDPDLDYLARIGVRDCYLETNDVGRARVYSKSICELQPLDWDNLLIYAELCAHAQASGELMRAKDAYETAFTIANAQAVELADVPEIWSHVNIYLEILDKLGHTATAIGMLKRLARWVLGRKEEMFWEQHYETDVEYDVGNERRGFVGEFQQGKATVDKSKFGEGLPLEIRVKLGLFRVKMGVEQHDEALKHLNILYDLADDAADHYDAFYVVADCLRLYRRFEDALRFYHALKEAMDGMTEEFALGLAECYHATARIEQALEIYRGALISHPLSVQVRIKLGNLYKDLGRQEDARPLLHEVAMLGKKQYILEEEDEVPTLPKPRTLKRLAPRFDIGDRRSLINPRTKRPYTRKYTRRKNKAKVDVDEEGNVVQALEEDMPEVPAKPAQPAGPRENLPPAYPPWSDQTSAFEDLERLWAAVEAEAEEASAPEEWLMLAAKTVELLRAEGAFYLTSGGRFRGYGKRYRQQEEATDAALDMLNRTQNDDAAGQSKPTKKRFFMAPSEFQGVNFHLWHRLIARLCLVYAERGEQQQCYNVLTEVLLKANVFNEPAFRELNSSIALCCALKFNDSKYATDIVRDYAVRSEFRASVPFQLINGVSNLCYGVDNALCSGAMQKFLFRGLKSMEFNLMPQVLRDRQEYGQQLDALQKRLAKYGPESGPPDAGMLVIYGNAMAINMQRNAALPYYLRALAIQPNNAMLNLSIGVSYIHTAMKRQTENRQYGIQQGISFIQRYHELRTASGDVHHIQEAEYNMAKAWHMLGLAHLAIPGYERVLRMSRQMSFDAEKHVYEIKEDFGMEAAYALQQLFMIAGNEEAAMALGQEWLVM
ncbi:hypothetical protein LTR62_002277 [Meristemomyces frigidus]|uniref:TPR-like protein n=1 Tax=Meristemomyces frigidus TaxID=1508187 RepID=A0AAN7TGY6_9PEZI|nr:hypothetical protein LTR62_002277 [Meristemomyces frigidus]